MIIETKLHIPQNNTTLVLRPRLHKRLNAGLKRKLTLITAPAGCWEEVESIMQRMADRIESQQYPQLARMIQRFEVLFERMQGERSKKLELSGREGYVRNFADVKRLLYNIAPSDDEVILIPEMVRL